MTNVLPITGTRITDLDYEQMYNNFKDAMFKLSLSCQFFSSDRYAEQKFKENKNEYAYVPSDGYAIDTLIKDMLTCYSLTKIKFIDIGCGVPLIPLFLHSMGINAIGLDNDTLLLRVVSSDKSFNIERSMIIEKDLFDADLSSYNVLYSYAPIKDLGLMRSGLESILSKMNRGATFYFKSVFLEKTLKDLDFIYLSNGLYKHRKQ